VRAKKRVSESTLVDERASVFGSLPLRAFPAQVGGGDGDASPHPPHHAYVGEEKPPGSARSREDDFLPAFPRESVESRTEGASR